MKALILVAALSLAVPSTGRAKTIQSADSATARYGCLACHADKRAAFEEGVHSERGIRCHDCHGGNPASRALPGAHGRTFTGSPGKAAVVALCGSCHSDPNQMRQYGLPTGIVAEFRTSRHGMLLLQQQNADAPTCTSCHDAHTILRPDDARSSVYPTNITGTCAPCHENQALMDKYGLPTDQVRLFEQSAHGLALRDQNFAAPTCLGCHGSHSALPPKVTEITSVCSRCHVGVGNAFQRGPHGPAAQSGKLAGCLACHGNHDTERVPAAQIAVTCRKCHEAGSEAVVRGERIQADVEQASGDLQAAARAIEEVTRAGLQTADLQFRFETARTAYLQITEVQHDLDLERLDDLTRSVRSISRDLRGAAEASAAHKWEHRLWLVPVWFLALAWISMSVLVLRSYERRGS
jgi:hypothetical protein